MSPGYPARTAALNSSDAAMVKIKHNMFFGGHPPSSYTTITLHSPPRLLQGSSLQMTDGRMFKNYTAFTQDLHDPVSVFTDGDNLINMYEMRNDTTQTHAAFLFSFKGRYTL